MKKIFTLTIQVSGMEEKISVMAAELALRSQVNSVEIEHIKEEKQKRIVKG